MFVMVIMNSESLLCWDRRRIVASRTPGDGKMPWLPAPAPER